MGMMMQIKLSGDSAKVQGKMMQFCVIKLRCVCVGGVQLYSTSVFLLNRTEHKPLKEGQKCVWLVIYIDFFGWLLEFSHFASIYHFKMSSQLTHTENADPGTSSLPLEVMISICLKTFFSKSITWMYKKEERSISKFSHNSKVGSGKRSVYFTLQVENPW